MTDSAALRKVIKDNGYKYNSLALRLKITPYSLQKKIDNKTDFKGREIAMLTKLLSLTIKEQNAIFFSKDVD